MNKTVTRSLLGGLLGTAAMTMMMYFVAPLMTGRTMDIAAELAAMMGGSWALGMAAHVANGVLIFPVIYALLLLNRLPGPPPVRGAIWGAVLWVVAQAMVMPMIGAGFFSASIGMKSAVASLVGHLVYGALLGAVTGASHSRKT